MSLEEAFEIAFNRFVVVPKIDYAVSELTVQTVFAMTVLGEVVSANVLFESLQIFYLNDCRYGLLLLLESTLSLGFLQG